MADANVPYRSSSFKDLSGQTFNFLTILHEGLRARNGRVMWVCRCVCNELTTVGTSHLTSNHTKSCGCIRSRLCRDAKILHGATSRIEDGKKTRSPEYQAWVGMIQRCCNENHDRYEDYGGRGITVSDEFRNSFEAFLDHVGLRLSPKHSLDRIENSKGYERGNLRWATKVEQNRNQRRNRHIKAFGKRQLLVDWSRETGLSVPTISSRLSRGWDPERALSTPTKRSL